MRRESIVQEYLWMASGKKDKKITSSVVSFTLNKKRKRKNASIFGDAEEEEEDFVADKDEPKKKRAVRLAEQGKFKESLMLFNQIIARGCKDATVYEMKSQILMELEDPFEAVRSAHRATELASDWHIAWLTLARAQLNFGEAEWALKSAEMAMKTASEKNETVLSFLREVRVIVKKMHEQGKDGRRLRIV